MRRATADGADKSLVGFELGGVLYAIDIGDVREILRPLPTLALPHVPSMVVGVIDHRGDVVPIVDLRRRFGLPAEPGREVRWVIVRSGTRLSGLVVDRVTEVFGASGPAEREVPAIEVGQDARGIIAAYTHRGRLVFVLDTKRLTSVVDNLDFEQVEITSEEARG